MTYELIIQAGSYSEVYDALGRADIATVTCIGGDDYRIFATERIYVEMAADALGCDYDEIVEVN